MVVWKGDQGFSAVLATVILIAIAVVLTGALFATVSRPGTDAAALALSAEHAPQPEDERTYTVAAATPRLAWHRLALLLDGVRLSYDDSLSRDASWCAIGGNGECILSGAWDLAASVDAGQKIRVHDSDIAGATFEVIDVEANMVLARVEMRN